MAVPHLTNSAAPDWPPFLPFMIHESMTCEEHRVPCSQEAPKQTHIKGVFGKTGLPRFISELKV